MLLFLSENIKMPDTKARPYEIKLHEKHKICIHSTQKILCMCLYWTFCTKRTLGYIVCCRIKTAFYSSDSLQYSRVSEHKHLYNEHLQLFATTSSMYACAYVFVCVFYLSVVVYPILQVECLLTDLILFYLEKCEGEQFAKMKFNSVWQIFIVRILWLTY